MDKILKNITALEISIDDTGVTIDASSEYIIPAQDYLLWSTSVDIISLVNSGDIVVNDGINDLTSFFGLKYLLYPHFAFNQRFLSEPERSNGLFSKTTQEAIEESVLRQNFSFMKVSAMAQPAIIPSNQQMIVSGIFEVDGIIDIVGELILIL